MGTILDNEYLSEIKSLKAQFIEIPALSDFPELVSGFTTRFGGLSKGSFACFNLNFNRPDPFVAENYKILSSSLNIPLKNMVLSSQVHGSNVLVVSAHHAGMGIVRERSYKDADGLVTDNSGLMLITLYADCVPIYLYDPVKKVIALAHSGWRGTLLNIAGETIRVLKDSMGCQPGDIHVAFGPHIRECCFEVSSDVAELFFDTFSWAGEYSSYNGKGKRVFDLEGIITECLLKCKIEINNISTCPICTCCNSDVFFSHRGSGGKAGTGAAFMMIKEEGL